MRVAVVGTVLVTLYAAVAALQALVLDPLAAAPGLDLGQIQARLAADGSSLDTPVVVAMLAVPVVVAVATTVVLSRAPALPAPATAVYYLALLALSGPLTFLASFGPGISMADTFGIGGGAHTGWPGALYLVSLLAFVATLACLSRLAVAAHRRRNLAAL